MFLSISIVLPDHLTNLICANTLLSMKITTDLLCIWKGWTTRAHGWWSIGVQPFQNGRLSTAAYWVDGAGWFIRLIHMDRCKEPGWHRPKLIERVEARNYIHWGWSLGGFFPALLIWPHKQQPLRNKSRISCSTCPWRKFSLGLWALGCCLRNCTTTAIPFEWPSMVRALQHTRFIQSPFLDINKEEITFSKSRALLRSPRAFIMKYIILLQDNIRLP